MRPRTPSPCNLNLLELHIHTYSAHRTGRSKSILKVVLIENVLDASEQRQCDAVRPSHVVIRKQISFCVSLEPQFRLTKRKVVLKHWREMLASSIQLKSELK